MADIGEEAGYSRGLANHHFGSRSELVERLTRRAQASFMAHLVDSGGEGMRGLAGVLGLDGEPSAAEDVLTADREAVALLLRRLAERAAPEVPDEGGVEVRALAAVVGAYLSTVGRRAESVRAFLVLWGASFAEESALREVFVADDARFRHGVEQVILLGQRNRTIAPDVDAAGAATAVVGMLRGVAAQFQVDPDGMDLDAARAMCVRFLTRALPSLGS